MSAPRFAVAPELAEALVLEHFSALRGFRMESVKQLGKVLADSSRSVPHARATAAVFDHLCPTPREIEDVAFNLREKFEPTPSLREKWKAEGGALDASFHDQVVRELAEKFGKKGEPSKDERMWRAIKQKLKVSDFAQVPWGQCWSTARELGFQLEGLQKDQADQWDRDHRDKPASLPDVHKQERRAAAARAVLHDITSGYQREQPEGSAEDPPAEERQPELEEHTDE